MSSRKYLCLWHDAMEHSSDIYNSCRRGSICYSFASEEKQNAIIMLHMRVTLKDQNTEKLSLSIRYVKGL